MADVTRAILKEGIKKRKSIGTSGKQALANLLKMQVRGGDPHLSENIDHYLYGAPKKYA